MEIFTGVDWRGIFVPQAPLLESFLRGTLTYLLLLLVLRVGLKRAAGEVGITDILVIVLIVEASGLGLVGETHSLTDGVLVAATVVLWSTLLDRLGYRYPAFGRLLKPSAIPLIRDGRILYRNLRRETLSEEDLLSALRKEGVERVELVRSAYMEGDGSISVIPKVPPAP